MIYFVGMVWVIFLLPLVAAWSQPDWTVRIVFTAMFLAPTMLLLGELRFALPIRWRARWPRWDAFLCRIGSHRCIRLCTNGCCWECLRCNPESRAVKNHLEAARG